MSQGLHNKMKFEHQTLNLEGLKLNFCCTEPNTSIYNTTVVIFQLQFQFAG